MSLTRPLQNKGYHIYCDNFYSSPELFSTVGFQACGTVRSNRRGLSKVFKSKKLQKGEAYSEKVSDSSVLWKDKRDVLLLSTIHDDDYIWWKYKEDQNLRQEELKSI